MITNNFIFPSLVSERHVIRNRFERVLLSSAANESTRKRVIGYTVGEYILLAIVSVLQVVYIRRLFSKSVAYNRV